jgi:predicted nucleic acid-binding protein
MDRLFLDANLLFSAAYDARSGLNRLWKLKRVQLFSSAYAVEEARVNLPEASQRLRLRKLCKILTLVATPTAPPPREISLPEKDVPIFLAALAANATQLLTGDLRHFGPHYDKRIRGVTILPPGDYLSRRIRE